MSTTLLLLLFLLLTVFVQCVQKNGGGLSLWIDSQQVKIFSGYFMGEIHVIDAGIVLPYILDPNFENYLPMIPSEVNSVNFTWRSGSKKYFYNFDILKTLDESILDPPQISIKTRGKIPKRPKVFSVYLPCSGNRSGIAPFEVGLLIETRKGKPLVGTPLRLKLRKECAPRGPDPECDKKCANGGWCNHEKICQCPEGYMGHYCKTALCYPQCMNGGNCTAPGVCSCPTGYQGRHCEGGICRDKCLNGGKCIQKDTCECPKGYFGRRCEYSKCVIPCLNGGKCKGANKCRCHIGYRGNHCEIDSRVSQRSLCTTPCRHGICQLDNTCFCDPGWTGKKCQKSSCLMVTIMSGDLDHSVMIDSDDDDGCPSSPGSMHYEDSGDLMSVAMSDEVTAQLAAAGWHTIHGPVGVAAAAAICSAKKRKRPHSFETNPSIRKRQQNRLLRKLRQTIDEFATRVGQQAVVLVATPGKPNTSFKCFGAKPLEDVVKNLRSVIMEELETALAQQAPPPVQDDPSLYELPPLIIDGIPTPVEKMTQAQLRAFIPLMLKYSTGRGKPGWGRETTRPPWWPKELPWANVRMDARSEEEKQKISWTHALRQIVINCYKFHGREDLLPAFSEDEDKASGVIKLQHTKVIAAQAQITSSPTHNALTQVQTSYAPAVLQTISNPDGTVSIIQVDPSNPIITLPDGTTAQVQGVATIHASQGDGTQTVHTVQTLQDSVTGESVAVDLNNVTEATLNQDGQIILTGEDGHGYPVSVSGMITVPVSASMYQTVVANIQHLTQASDGTMQVVTPVVQVPKVEPSNENGVETITVTSSGNLVGHQMVAMGNGNEPQVLQVLSLKDASVLTKAIAAQQAQNVAEVKTEITDE